MSAYDNSGVSILESNNHDALSIQNSVSLVPLHSQNKVTDSQKKILETKKVKIFVKRSMFRSFVDKLLSRGIIISAEDEPDEMNSTESFKCISTKNQYKSRHTFEKSNTQKTNQIELNTKYGLDNPSRIISAIQKDKTTEKNESDDNSLINKIHNRECIGPECLESNVDKTGDPRNDKKRDENSHSGMCEIFSELISSQIVTPAKASRCEEASEKYPHSAQKRDHYRDYKHKDDSPFSATGNADASNSLTRMALDTSTAKITPARTATQHACLIKYENQEHVEFSSNSFQLNPQRSFMGTISALMCATNLMDENCNLNQSCQFMDLLEADNNEGANLAQTIFKIDETLIRAVDAIKELHNRVKQLETFSVAHNLRESFSWVDDTFHITSNGSKTWDNRKKSAENKIAQELLAAIGRK